ncbi:hypothetical protein EPAKOI_000220 [Cupriavidus sp. H18C2]
MNHLEAFDKFGSFKMAINLDGTINPLKTEKAKLEGRKLK